jgi:predicted DNA-binding transcriptional regulator
MPESQRIISSQWATQSPGVEEERLDRALVTGLMMEMILETSTIQVDPQIRRNLVETRLKTVMVDHLAGRVTLKRFRHLLREVDHCFPRYYSLIAPVSPHAPAPTAEPSPALSPPSAPPLPINRALRQDALQAWLEAEVRELLPQRSHRKLGVKRLLDFLQLTRGGWFRLRDFEAHFGVDRKTAWEYLQKFLTAGLLCHNHRRSTAVRYALATRFLVVLVDALRPKVKEALPELSPQQADQVCDWLVATGGEPFDETAWQVHLKASRCRQIIACLKAAGLLEEVTLAGLGQMFKLPRQWLQD